MVSAREQAASKPATNQPVNRTPKAYRFWFPPLALRRRLPSRYAIKEEKLRDH